MDEEAKCDINVFDLTGLEDIKSRADILAKIKLDVTPAMVMEPRFQSKSEDRQKLREISGYMFYIESQCEPPALMLMRVGSMDTTSTVGKINEAPGELLRKAITHPAENPCNGMYAITLEIKAWLGKELGI